MSLKVTPGLVGPPAGWASYVFYGRGGFPAACPSRILGSIETLLLSLWSCGREARECGQPVVRTSPALCACTEA